MDRGLKGKARGIYKKKADKAEDPIIQKAERVWSRGGGLRLQNRTLLER